MPGVTYMVQTPSDKVSVPPLISRAASRRFYFDVVNSAYGWRVQISQVTAHYRSIISFPINELINFREKLNELMEELGIDRPAAGSGQGAGGDARGTTGVPKESPGRRDRGASRRGAAGGGGQRRANRNRSFRRSRQERKSESEREHDSSVEKGEKKGDGPDTKETPKETPAKEEKSPPVTEVAEADTTEDKATCTDAEPAAPVEVAIETTS